MNADRIQCRTVPARATKVYNGATFQKTPNLPILGRSTFSASQSVGLKRVLDTPNPLLDVHLIASQ